MKKLAATLATTAVALTFAAGASAQSFQKPEDAIKYRQGAFRVLSAHFGVLGAMANGKAPFDARKAAYSGEVIQLVSHLPFAGFVPASDKGETRAKADVWSDEARFHTAAEKMQGEVGKLATAARSGSPDNLKAAFGPAAQSCKGCHDNFRKD